MSDEPHVSVMSRHLKDIETALQSMTVELMYLRGQRDGYLETTIQQNSMLVEVQRRAEGFEAENVRLVARVIQLENTLNSSGWDGVRGLENEICANMVEEAGHDKLARKMRVDYDRRKLNAC